MPFIDHAWAATPSPNSLSEWKGVGEVPSIGGPGPLMNAVIDALTELRCYAHRHPDDATKRSGDPKWRLTSFLLARVQIRKMSPPTMIILHHGALLVHESGKADAKTGHGSSLLTGASAGSGLIATRAFRVGPARQRRPFTKPFDRTTCPHETTRTFVNSHYPRGAAPRGAGQEEPDVFSSFNICPSIY